MSEEYDYNYMTMWIEPYSHTESIIENTKSDSKSDSKSKSKSESIIDTYISSEPDNIYDEWKMIWN